MIYMGCSYDTGGLSIIRHDKTRDGNCKTNGKGKAVES